MIRKISVQDVVSKRATKSKREDDETTASDPNRQERDYLIERLTRKRVAPTIIEEPVKKKNSPKKNKFQMKWVWLSFPIVLILFAFIVLQFLYSATVIVKPKSLSVKIDTKITASIDATTSPNVLTYHIITLNALEKESVLATSSVTTKPQKASGQILIFNSYSAKPQTLVANTRFETSNGLVYRIKNAVSVPGYTVVDSKIKPGSVTATVTADQTGSKYNVGFSDFTIPGFKTDIGRYSKITAGSKTVMSGGNDGNSFGVSQEARQNARTIIEARLRENLLKQVQSSKTADSIIFENANKITFQNLSDTLGQDDEHAVIHMQGTISAIVFDKKTISKLLLKDSIAKVGNNAEISGLEKLHFIAAVSSTSPVWQPKPFDFTLTGTVDVVGVVDKDKFLQDILGIQKSDLQKLFKNYPTIDSITPNIKPVWKRSLPSDASKIKIEIVK